MQRAAIAVAGLLVAITASASPVLHEPVPSDPAEDARLGVSIDGELPAALATQSGVVEAPDPRRSPGAPSRPPDPETTNAPPNAVFRPDRDTRRPDVVPYDDPFTPSIAPFKRLVAFDTVDASYRMTVRDGRLTPLGSRGEAAADGTDDTFFGDLVVDLVPGRPQRVPSVGPGARILHARAGVGSQDVPVRFQRDGADNWFVTGDVNARVRLVMEEAVPRATFGGEMTDPSWGDLANVAPAPLPPGVARAAAQVAARIGVSRAQSPREVITKLVAYFRGFTDSEDFPTGEDIYLALALSKKGLCRHRAFAFVVTALGLGLPARLIENEAHAWVEVTLGSMWKRIDLGGAGRALDATLAGTVKYSPPPDTFAWPANASRGDELADRARNATSATSATSAATSGGPAPGSSPGAPHPAPSAQAAKDPSASRDQPRDPHDDRPPAHVTLALALTGSDARRGVPLRVTGEVKAAGDPCGHVLVEVGLRDNSGHLLPIGALAADDEGKFDGTLMIPGVAALGDYDVYARSSGDAKCGPGVGP